MQLTNYFIPALAIPFLLLACIVYFDAFYKGNQVKAEIVALGKNYNKIVLFSVIGYLITFCLMVSNIYKLTLLQEQEIILLSIMPAVLIYVFINTMYTDTLVKKISRQYLRVCYISQFAIGAYMINHYAGENKMWGWIMLGIYVGLVVLLFLFARGVGASDVRIIAVLSPIQVCYVGSFALLLTLASFFLATLYQFYKQVKAQDRKLSVPIGPPLIIPVVIAVFILPHFGYLMNF